MNEQQIEQFISSPQGRVEIALVGAEQAADDLAAIVNNYPSEIAKPMNLIALARLVTKYMNICESLAHDKH